MHCNGKYLLQSSMVSPDLLCFQQEALIGQLQEQHYQQYMQQVFFYSPSRLSRVLLPMNQPTERVPKPSYSSAVFIVYLPSALCTRAV